MGSVPGIPFLVDTYTLLAWLPGLTLPVLFSLVRLRQMCSGGDRLRWLIPTNQAPIQTLTAPGGDSDAAPALPLLPQVPAPQNAQPLLSSLHMELASFPEKSPA